MSGEALLQVEGVHAAYQSGVDILQGLSLQVRANSLTLVIGPNGAGKSTLLKAIFGFLAPHQGQVQFRGAPIHGLEPHQVKALGISYVPQETNTFPHLTVEENLCMGGWILRGDRSLLKDRLAGIYDTFPVLAQRKQRPAGELSGGQRRMLAVAREMMTEPMLMLVDEPTVGLQPNLVGEVYELLARARKVIGTTILLVDQNIEDALGQADFVYMVNLGRIKAEGPRAEFPLGRIRDLIRECLAG